MDSEMMKAALNYAAHGWAVFPLKQKAKQPATKNGFHDATTEPELIKQWWTKNPAYNIGIATGKPSGGLVIIDIDEDEEKDIHGSESLRSWERENGELPETVRVLTGRGGVHLFYTDAEKTHKSRAGILPGVDVRADGGYIVAPPSIHPNGREYEFEGGFSPDEITIAEAGEIVRALLGRYGSKKAEQPEEVASSNKIPVGERVKSLVQLAGYLFKKGVCTTTIHAVIENENKERCNPPLTDEQMEKEVFPIFGRGWKASEPYFQPVQEDFGLPSLADVEELEPQWLIPGYLPKGSICVLAGDGGVGKSTVWCSIAAAISRGEIPYYFPCGENPFLKKLENKTVLFLSGEDSPQHVLKRRLINHEADEKNLFTLTLTDERFKEAKFGNPFFEKLIEKYRPALTICDPLQSFIPADLRMESRNAMRQCLQNLAKLGEKYETVFLIVAHSNKRAGASGRNRLADSADLWDISRSVLFVGFTGDDDDTRYLSQEKSNYGMLQQTILFDVQNGKLFFKGLTKKRDADFISSREYKRPTPQNDEARDFIIENLKNGAMSTIALKQAGAASGIKENTLTKAYRELEKEKKITGIMKSDGKSSGVTKVFSLCEGKIFDFPNGGHTDTPTE